MKKQFKRLIIYVDRAIESIGLRDMYIILLKAPLYEQIYTKDLTNLSYIIKIDNYN